MDRLFASFEKSTQKATESPHVSHHASFIINVKPIYSRHKAANFLTTCMQYAFG